MTYLLLAIVLVVITASFLLVAYVFRSVSEMVHGFKDERIITRSDQFKQEEGLRDEIRSLTTALGQAANIQLIYPRRGPLEPTEQWFQGTPKIVKVSSDGRQSNGGNK